MPKAGKWNLGPLGYFWLFVSVLLNISGLSSIVQGFVELGGFLGDIVDQYRTWIREPIRAAFGFFWVPLPWWLADWLVMNGSFIVAFNALSVYHDAETALSVLTKEFRANDSNERRNMVIFVLSLILLGPIAVPLIVILDRARGTAEGLWDNDFRFLYLLWLTILGTVTILLFLNWQGQKLGYW